MPLFDSYLTIDWSANSAPSFGKDSLWYALLERGREPGKAPGKARNPRTRRQARDEIAEILRDQRDRRRRVLAGFDFAFGYPHGFARLLGPRPGSLPWRWVWDEIGERIQDGADNVNNRFEVAAALNARIGDPAAPGPFWGRPHSRRDLATLASKSSPFPYPAGRETSLERYRITERILRNAGWSHIQEVWKLFTAGSVGGQTLTGIPVVRRLRDSPDFAAVSAIWPFETGFTPHPAGERGERRPFLLFAEIWPGFLRPLEMTDGDPRDERQVLGLNRLFARLDEEGRLGPLFDRPAGLSDEQARICVEEEGAILGADPDFLRQRPPRRSTPLPYPFFSGD